MRMDRRRLCTLAALLIACFQCSCSDKWFQDASDDNTGHVPILVINPDRLLSPRAFEVQVYGQSSFPWCLGIRLTSGEFYVGRVERSVTCTSVPAGGAVFSYPVVLVDPLVNPNAALLAELSAGACVGEDAGESSADRGSICPGAAPARRTAWPADQVVSTPDASPVRDASSRDAAPKDAGADSEAGRTVVTTEGGAP